MGSLLQNAASRILQINPEELRAGIRSVPQSGGRVSGEVYLYDTLPGGAGYARDVNRHLQAILEEAVRSATTCVNVDCPGACYQCLLDYQNQQYHRSLDRLLGLALLRFVLNGERPFINDETATALVAHVRPYLPSSWTLLPQRTIAGYFAPLVCRNDAGNQLAIVPRHTLRSQPPVESQQQFLITGMTCCSFTEFDLSRRPFWVMNELAQL